MTVGKRQEASLKAPMSDDEEGEDDDKNDDNRGDGDDDGDEVSFSQFDHGAVGLSYHFCNKKNKDITS
jgi:hypothetical protein